MRAIVSQRYGGPETLRLEDVDRPVIDDERVLVRVRASSVNAVDWHLMRGTPYVIRLTDGLRRPKQPRRGVDLAGDVEEVGAAVTRFKPGDEVFGGGVGTWAELARAKASNLAHKPPGVSFEEAAAVPVAALTALQGLRDRAGVTVGQRVLVNGAGGGVGTFVVQIARAFGADVTAVTSTRNVAMVASIGAGRVFDYEREDFVRDPARYDVVFDVGGNRSLPDLGRVTAPGGVVLLCGAGRGQWIGPFVRIISGGLRSRFGGTRMAGFLATHNQPDITTLAEMLAAGTIRPVVDRSFPLAEAADAVRHMEAGAQGKVVIAV